MSDGQEDQLTVYLCKDALHNYATDRCFAEAWPDRLIVQRTVAQIRQQTADQLQRRGNPTLLDKLGDLEVRLWYSLAGYTKQIGVAQWERSITQLLPDDLKSSLPSVEEIEAELSGVSDD